jgi:hypothetical protein
VGAHSKAFAGREKGSVAEEAQDPQKGADQSGDTEGEAADLRRGAKIGR